MSEETLQVGGVWMPPEDYVATAFKLSKGEQARLLRRFRDMLNPNSKRVKEKFDPRHVKRFSAKMVYVYVTKPNAAGEAAPRIVKRGEK